MVSLRFTSLAALVIAGLSVQNSDAATTNYNAKVNTTSPVEKRAGGCVSFTQNFATGSDMTQYWNDKVEVPGTWDLQSNAIELKVLKPGKLHINNMQVVYPSIFANNVHCFQ